MYLPSRACVSHSSGTTDRKAVDGKTQKRQTVVRGLPAEGNDLPELLKQLKDRCGAGGALKEDELEIQGDQLVRVREALQQLGFKVKG